jgi:hypothetical protein
VRRGPSAFEKDAAAGVSASATAAEQQPSKGDLAGGEKVDGSEYIVRFNDYLMQDEQRTRLEASLSAADPVRTPPAPLDDETVC